MSLPNILILAGAILAVLALLVLLLAKQYKKVGPNEALIISGRKKVVDVDKYYDRERLRPLYKSFLQKPFFIVTNELIHP